jgi:hypothetical protein
MQATRNPKYSSPAPSPVAVVIFDDNTGPEYTRPLETHLRREFGARGLHPSIRIITGAEFNEDEILAGIVATANSIVLVRPIGGTRNSFADFLTQILYDVRVFVITKQPEFATETVWRARVDTSSGTAGLQSRLEDFAQQLVGKLVDDRVLASR